MPIFYYMAPNVFLSLSPRIKGLFQSILTFKLVFIWLELTPQKSHLGRGYRQGIDKRKYDFVVAAEEIPDSDKYNITVQKVQIV